MFLQSLTIYLVIDLTLSLICLAIILKKRHFLAARLRALLNVPSTEDFNKLSKDFRGHSHDDGIAEINEEDPMDYNDFDFDNEKTGCDSCEDGCCGKN